MGQQGPFECRIGRDIARSGKTGRDMASIEGRYETMRRDTNGDGRNGRCDVRGSRAAEDSWSP